jgi:hypothetical protein
MTGNVRGSGKDGEHPEASMIEQVVKPHIENFKAKGSIAKSG